MTEEKPKIDDAVEEKIDQKIEAAKLGEQPQSVRTGEKDGQTRRGGDSFGVSTTTTTSRPLREQNPLNTTENLASSTTAEEDKRTASQRDVNITWENTQKNIALFVVTLTMLVSSAIVIRSVFYGTSDANLAIAAYTFISSTTSLVVAFYFSRTNHARIGDEKKKTTGGLDDR